MKAGLEPAQASDVEREEVEEKSPFVGRRERDELAPAGRGRSLVEILQVFRLPAEPRTVIDDLAVDLAGREINEGHGKP